MRTRARVNVHLRSPQVAYLRYLAERDGTGLSAALAWIIADRARQGGMNATRAHKILLGMTLPQDALAYVDRLSVEWGLERSDVLRRLIDEAEMRDRLVTNGGFL